MYTRGCNGVLTVGKSITTKPEYLQSKHLTYLDQLRESGTVNMFGAVPFLLQEFPDLDLSKAKHILFYWLHSYVQRNPKAKR